MAHQQLMRRLGTCLSRHWSESGLRSCQFLRCTGSSIAVAPTGASAATRHVHCTTASSQTNSSKLFGRHIRSVHCSSSNRCDSDNQGQHCSSSSKVESDSSGRSSTGGAAAEAGSEDSNRKRTPFGADPGRVEMQWHQPLPDYEEYRSAALDRILAKHQGPDGSLQHVSEQDIEDELTAEGIEVDWEEVRRLESLLNRKPKPGRPSGRTNLRGWEEDEWMKAGFYDAYKETSKDDESS